MKKKNKVKTIIAIVLIVVALISASLVALSVNSISYSMAINEPNRIIVYHNSSINNKVYEKSNDEYNHLYSLITDSFKQKILPALVSGELNKNVKIKSESGKINPSNICIALVYDAPQVLKFKKNLYNDANGKSYWYQSLIFNVVNTDDYQYHTISIIPPDDSTEFSSNFHYNLYYEVYANFNELYNYSSTLFD